MSRGRKRRGGGRTRHSSVEVSEQGGLRTLHLGGEAIQSAIRLSAPNELALAYTRAMMSFLLFVPQPRDLLMIGLGGGSMARFVYERMPAVDMTTVEINPQVIAAARNFFDLPPDDERFRVELDDGGQYVRRRRNACDVLLLDAFEDGCLAEGLTTVSFYDACYACLRPGGVLVVNFIESEPRFDGYLARIEHSFDGKVLMLPSEDGFNNIVLAFKEGPTRVGIETLKQSARTLKRRYRLPFDVYVRELVAHNPTTAAHLRIGLSH